MPGDGRLDRDVAIKVLLPEQASDTRWLERFRREVRAVASLNHPNIVTIHGVEEAEGLHFFSMELVEGRTLATIIPATGMVLDAFWEIAIPLADAVGAAHERGVTHRDLKPSNIMLGDNDRLKVLDFGLAKTAPTEASPSPETRTETNEMTLPGVILGTIPYMSPEQVQGRSVDSRSDVFSLGVILYEMLTGERPFQGASAAEVMSAILRDSPRLPARLLSPDATQGLESVVLTCLERDPARRYPSARELREGLESAKSHTPRAAEPTAPSIAVLAFADMSQERDQDYFCEGMAEEIINALAGIEGLHVASRTSSFRFRAVGADIQDLGKRLRVGTVLEGSVRKAGPRLRVTAQLTNVSDGYQLWSSRYDRELEDVFAIQDEIAQTIVEALKIELSERERRTFERSVTTDVEAYDFYLRGRKFFYEGTRKGIELAREMFSRAVRRDPIYALAHAGLADCYSYLFMYFDKTAANKEAAVGASLEAVQLGEGFAHAHAARGLALSLDQQYAEAEREFESALQLNPRHFEACYFYARVSREQGKHDQAARLFEEASRVRPEDYQSFIFLAAAYSELERPTDRRNALVQARDAVSRHLDTHPYDARALYLGGSVLIQLGEVDEGLRWGKRALDLDPDDPRVLYNLACLQCKAGGTAEAIEYFERSLAAGYASREWIENDSDLDPIRDQPRFKAAVARLD